MVTPELKNFIKIELERNTSQEEITSKLLSAGWDKEDIAETLTEIKVPSSNLQPTILPEVKKVEQPIEIKPAPQTFDPYKESVARPTTTFTYKPPASPLPEASPTLEMKNEPLIPPIQPKSLGDIQNEVGFTPKIITQKEVPPVSLEQYQNKFDKVVVPQTTISNPIIDAPKKSHNFLGIIFVVIILFLLGGGVFAFMKGYIKIPFTIPFEVPFLKKDPHQVLIQMNTEMAKVTSFKSEMTFKTSFPALSEMMNLFMGAPSTEMKEDSISISNKFSYSGEENVKRANADFVGSSSLIDKIINVNVRTIGSTTYLKFSGLEDLIPKNITIPTGWVSISKSDIDSIYTIAKSSGQVLPNEEDKNAIFNVLSSFELKNLISIIPIDPNTTIIENSDEVLNNIDTYHYSITIDSLVLKNAIHKLAEGNKIEFKKEEWDIIDQNILNIKIDAFDVWIGKKDSLLYKFKVAVNMPINSALGINDPNSQIYYLKTEFGNTFSDFNSKVEITDPENATSILVLADTLQKTIKNEEIKSSMQALTQSFGKLHDIEKIYGYKSNEGGSCSQSVSGSLYSKLGHKKSAGEAVSELSLALSDLILISQDKAKCYSTPYAWAISAPEISDPTKYFCSDSTGSFIESDKPLTGVVCK